MILIVGSSSLRTAEFSTLNNLGPSTLYQGKLSNEKVYHTSMSDCPKLKEHLELFDKIYWAQSSKNEFVNFQEYFETIYLLKQHNNVIGLNEDPCHLKENYLVSNIANSIVFLGCSHTKGGYVEPSEEYSNIVCEYFNLSPLNLAKASQGNFRSFDIFNQIDFFKDQIVILQLTDFARIRYFPDDRLESVLNEAQLYRIKNPAYIQVFNDKQLIYDTLNRLDSVIKFSRSFGLKLVFFNLGNVPNFNNNPSNDLYKKTVEYYLRDYKEYIPNILSKCVDRGNDRQHWGKLSNRMFADEIIKKIETLY